VPSPPTGSSSYDRSPPPCPNREPETDQEGLRHPASGATSREDPDSIAASPANPAVAHRAPPSSEDGLAGPRRGSRASDTEPAVSIEDEQASIISMTDRRRALLTAALGFLELPPRAPELRLSRSRTSPKGSGGRHSRAIPCSRPLDLSCAYAVEGGSGCRVGGGQPRRGRPDWRPGGTSSTTSPGSRRPRASTRKGRGEAERA
jgi:hypothetical protein